MREYAWDEQISKAEGERGGEHEAVATRELGVREHTKAGYGHGREQERCHAANDRVGDCSRS